MSPLNLAYRDASGAIRSFPLDEREKSTIGRVTGQDLVLNDRRVSRSHAWIERVGDSFLLRDAGSSNGTFLNGLRLGGSNAITLREGDVIEIGSTRFLFGRSGEGPRDPESSPGEAEPPLHDVAFPLEDLLRDGLARVQERNGGKPDPQGLKDRVWREVLAIFSGATVLRGLEKTLELVMTRLELDTAAAFMRSRTIDALELAAAKPSPHAARNMGGIASSAWTDGGGHIFRTPSPAEPARLEDTCRTTCERTFVAAPLLQTGGALAVGVLVGERLGGPRLDRNDLAYLSLVTERVGRVLCLRGKPEDTKIWGAAE